MKRLVLTLALLSTPFSAWAACSGHEQTATMSCADGQTWDRDANRCVPIVTG